MKRLLTSLFLVAAVLTSHVNAQEGGECECKQWNKIGNYNGLEVWGKVSPKEFANNVEGSCIELKLKNTTDKKLYGSFEYRVDYGNGFILNDSNGDFVRLGKDGLLPNYKAKYLRAAGLFNNQQLIGSNGLEPGEVTMGDPSKGYSKLYKCFRTNDGKKIERIKLMNLIVNNGCERFEQENEIIRQFTK